MPSLRWEDHDVHIMSSVTLLYKNLELTDCVLDTSGGFIQCHKTILAACSPYLKKLFMDHHEMKIIPFKEVKFNDMKLVLDFVYYGEVDVSITDVTSLIETAKLLQIMTLTSSCSHFSEKCSVKDERSRGDSGVNLVKCEEWDLPSQGNGIMCNIDFVSCESLNSSCENIDVQSVGSSESKAVHSLKTPSKNVIDVRSKVCIPNSSEIITDVERERENFGIALKPITFVAVSPVSVKSEELDYQPSVFRNSHSQSIPPQEECPYDWDNTTVNGERDSHSESQMKVEIKREIGVGELHCKIVETSSISEAMESNLRSDIVSEMKYTSNELTTTADADALMDSEHILGFPRNHNITILDKTNSSVYSEAGIIKRTEDLKIKFESICDISESVLKEEEPFRMDLNVENNEDAQHEQLFLNQESEFFKSERDEFFLSDHRHGSHKKLGITKICEPTLKGAAVDSNKNSIPNKGEIPKDISVFITTCGPSRTRFKLTAKHTDEKKISRRDQESFNCPECDATFCSKIKFDLHFTSHETHLSSSKLTNKLKLSQHLPPSGARKKPASCRVYELPFREKSNPERHKPTHASEKKKLSCTFCDKTFAKKNSLHLHLRTHGEKLFLCSSCDASFYFSGNLKVHMRTHTGEKPFSCDECQAAFRDSSNLRVHKRTHTGEKPFSCRICGATFRITSHLKKHMRTHTGEKPASCGICLVSFCSTSSLNRHMGVVHSGVKRFSCDACDKFFRDKCSLKAHMQTHATKKLV